MTPLDWNRNRSAVDGLHVLAAALAIVLSGLAVFDAVWPREEISYRQSLAFSEHGVGILLAGNRLPINEMQREDFLVLPGIGPKLADRIIAARKRRGGFSRSRQLLDVPGIGLKKFRAISALIEGPRSTEDGYPALASQRQ
jgi:hypothetical protein